jgi:hypothetical protein
MKDIIGVILVVIGLGLLFMCHSNDEDSILMNARPYTIVAKNGSASEYNDGSISYNTTDHYFTVVYDDKPNYVSVFSVSGEKFYIHKIGERDVSYEPKKIAKFLFWIGMISLFCGVFLLLMFDEWYW